METDDLLSGETVAKKATEMRERAHDRIVMAFRAQLEGSGLGPTDEDLQCFARLAHVEQQLNRCAQLANAVAACAASFTVQPGVP